MTEQHAQGYWRKLVASEAIEHMDSDSLGLEIFKRHLDASECGLSTEEKAQFLYEHARDTAAETLAVMEHCRRLGAKP